MIVLVSYLSSLDCLETIPQTRPPCSYPITFFPLECLSCFVLAGSLVIMGSVDSEDQPTAENKHYMDSFFLLVQGLPLERKQQD